MSQKLPADYHLHTHNSGDSTAPMKGMIESAIDKCLSEICFTEHMDLDFPVMKEVAPDTFTLDIDSYREELFRFKEEYKNKIIIKYGIELGLQTQIIDQNKSLIKSHDFDFVIGSIHLVDKKDPFYPYLWDGQEEEAVVKRYFELALENVKHFNDYDVLGHLDYIVRYLPSKRPFNSYEKYKEIIDEILRIVVRDDKGLDFNSKSLFYGGTEPNPSIDILKRYKEIGGRIITFGSDAHKPDGIAGSFDKAIEIAKGCGFTEYYTFNKRVPTSHKL